MIEMTGADVLSGNRNKIVFISWSPDEGALVMVSFTLVFSISLRYGEANKGLTP